MLPKHELQPRNLGVVSKTMYLFCGEGGKGVYLIHIYTRAYVYAAYIYVYIYIYISYAYKYIHIYI